MVATSTNNNNTLETLLLLTNFLRNHTRQFYNETPTSAAFNATNTTLAPPLIEPPFNIKLFKISIMILYSFIFLLGVPGNVLVILTIVRVPKMRSAKNLFIANLAVGDLVSVLWCCTNSMLGLFVSWPYGEGVCKYLYPVADVIIANTIFTMVLISIERYRAIISPFANKPTLKRTVFAIVLFWALSYVLVGIPLVVATKLGRGYLVAKVCSLQWLSRAHELSYRLATFICVFLMPFSIVLFCFVRIKYQLEENIRFASTSLRGRSTLKRAKKNQRLIKMLLVIFLSFTFCFLPINIILVTVTFYKNIMRWKYAIVLSQMAIALLFLNSTMNPIILYLLSRDFRMGYLQQIKCLCPSSAKIQWAVAGLQRVSTTSFRLSGIGSSKRRHSVNDDAMSDDNKCDKKVSFTSIEENNALLNFNGGGNKNSSYNNLLSPQGTNANDNNNGLINKSNKKKKVSWVENSENSISIC